jgi:hypothetical protein
LTHFTLNELQATFDAFDRLHFEGVLNGMVRLVVATLPANAPSDVELGDLAHGATSPDGREIRLNPEGDHEWEFTLLHEMVHSFEALFPGQIVVTQEGSVASARCPVVLYGPHSPPFFTRLFEIMRARGHDPKVSSDLHRYFG